MLLFFGLGVVMVLERGNLVYEFFYRYWFGVLELFFCKKGCLFFC